LTDWFRGRFVRRHGLTEAEAESVLRALLPLRAPTATVSDLYVPIRPGG
jgi:anaerobic selenocysteine-containing dehydrogenase